MKWALIGASRIAREWMVEALRAVGDEVVGVCSRDAGRAAQLATDFGLARHTDELQQLQGWGLDAVYISSTNEQHEAQTLFAAAQGWHVLCEKPLATSLEAARRMVEACDQAGVVMGTNHHLRHHAAQRRMRELVREGAVGQPLSARVHHAVWLREILQGWRVNDAAAGGGVVLDIAVHNADLLAFVLGEYPQEVQAMAASSGMGQGVEDQALSLWRFPSGLMASTHQAFNTPHASMGVEILGAAGSLRGHDVLNQRAMGSLSLHTAAGEAPQPLAMENLYVRGLREFHAAVAGRPNDLADGQAGLRSLAVALAILRSAQSGRAEAVQY